MSRSIITPARTLRRHLALAAIYAAATAACWARVDAPRWLWTVAMPLLPVAVVAVGFHRWRLLCPLAAVGAVGARLAGNRRRAPPWMDRWSPVLALSLLLVGLVARHTMINGDHDCLGCALLVLAIAAVATNALLSGRAWCNFLCPVGVVERIYTDGGKLADAKSSRCDRCSGCKPRCPDIDQDRSHRASATAAPSAIAYYAFPGLVFGFYGYYRLRWGDWSAFFEGAWTDHAFDRDVVLGPGFTFAPAVPAIVACTVTLVVAAAVSWAIFAGLEAVLRRRLADTAELRPRMLAIAAFTAFNLFYLFAGQPTLRRFPLLGRLAAFAVPVLATMVLVRRWNARAATPSRSRLDVVRSGGEVPCTRPTESITT